MSNVLTPHCGGQDLKNFDETSNAQDNLKERNAKDIFNRLERQPGRM